MKELILATALIMGCAGADDSALPDQTGGGGAFEAGGGSSGGEDPGGLGRTGNQATGGLGTGGPGAGGQVGSGGQGAGGQAGSGGQGETGSGGQGAGGQAGSEERPGPPRPLRLDLQGPDGLLMDGWQAAELIGYDQGKGFGWDDPTDVRSIFSNGPSGIPNPLNEDAHYGRSPGTFKIAVPNGTYCVGIGLDGGTSGSRGLPAIDKVDVTIEGVLRFDDVGRLGSLSLRYDDVDVRDGVLEITIADDGGSTNHWSIFAIDVDPDLSRNAACLQ